MDPKKKNIKVTITADEPDVASDDTAEGRVKMATKWLAKRRMDKASEFDEEAGDGQSYLDKHPADEPELTFGDLTLTKNKRK